MGVAVLFIIWTMPRSFFHAGASGTIKFHTIFSLQISVFKSEIKRHSRFSCVIHNGIFSKRVIKGNFSISGLAIISFLWYCRMICMVAEVTKSIMIVVLYLRCIISLIDIHLQNYFENGTMN